MKDVTRQEKMDYITKIDLQNSWIIYQEAWFENDAKKATKALAKTINSMMNCTDYDFNVETDMIKFLINVYIGILTETDFRNIKTFITNFEEVMKNDRELGNKIEELEEKINEIEDKIIDEN